MKNRGSTTKHTNDTKKETNGSCPRARFYSFRVFGVFRGSKKSFGFSQSLPTSAATILVFVARTTAAQSTNDIPPLLPALPEIPPTLWEQHGLLIVVMGALALLVVVAAIAWLLRSKPVVPVPIEIQTRRELELLRQRPDDGKTLSEVSRCLRRYFVVAFELSSGEMNTGEFCRAIHANEKVGDDLATDVSEFLRRADEIKFAPSPSVSENDSAKHALELFERGETRRAEFRHVARPT